MVSLVKYKKWKIQDLNLSIQIYINDIVYIRQIKRFQDRVRRAVKKYQEQVVGVNIQDRDRFKVFRTEVFQFFRREFCLWGLYVTTCHGFQHKSLSDKELSPSIFFIAGIQLCIIFHKLLKKSQPYKNFIVALKSFSC